MLFSEIKGYDELKATLVGAVDSGHIAHAQLFFGPEGSAAMALALAYITYVNCENKQSGDACGKCASCHKMKGLVHPDLTFLYPTAGAKKNEKELAEISVKWREFLRHSPYGNLHGWNEMNGQTNKLAGISADDTRSILKTLSFKSFESEYKSVIIWLPELMNMVAANSLLKILEEPPPKTIFILVAEDREKLLLTILSRTQGVQVRSFTDSEIKEILVEQTGLNETKAMQAALLAEGNLNRALELAENADDDRRTVFREWMGACYKRDYRAVVSAAEEFKKLGREAQADFFKFGLTILRECLAVKFGDRSVVRLKAEELDFVEKFAAIVNERNLPLLSEELSKACYYIERNGNPALVYTATSINVAQMLRA